MSGVTFQLTAEPDDVQAALNLLDQAGITWRRDSEDASENTIIVDSTEQLIIDRVVDSFRRKNVSISAIIRKRLTLEEAFLQLVDRNSDEIDDVRRGGSSNQSASDHNHAKIGDPS